MFHFIALMILILLGQACGTDDSKDNEKQPVATVATSSKTPHALALKDKNDLPDCTDENQNQLVYLTSEKLFFTCDDLEWVEINIDVPDPVAAKRESVFTNAVWTDPKTNKKWIVLGVRQTIGSLCNGRAVEGDASDNYIYDPDTKDLQEALRNGMFKGYNLPIWVGPTGARQVIYSSFPDIILDTWLNGTAVQVCRLREPK